MLKKPWNPYIRRHSALTEKAKNLKEPMLKQHAGWSPNSQMHLKYEHWFANESNDAILELWGLKTKPDEINKLAPVQCPNCGESNKIDSKFCSKCRRILSYDAYSKVIEEKNQDIMNKMGLTPERLGKLDQLFKQLEDKGII
ncbi:MAG TPA: zinc ribbon domain-containing protein [Nitrososphaeraceae archaeon]